MEEAQLNELLGRPLSSYYFVATSMLRLTEVMPQNDIFIITYFEIRNYTYFIIMK